MSGIYQSVKACIFKPSPSTDKSEVIKSADDVRNADDIKETDGNSSLKADKKTDEVNDPSNQPGILWRVSSGVYSTATGAVGLGVGGVKWVAGKTYDAGSVVYSKAPSNPLRKKKDKNE